MTARLESRFHCQGCFCPAFQCECGGFVNGCRIELAPVPPMASLFIQSHNDCRFMTGDSQKRLLSSARGFKLRGAATSRRTMGPATLQVPLRCTPRIRRALPREATTRERAPWTLQKVEARFDAER